MRPLTHPLSQGCPLGLEEESCRSCAKERLRQRSSSCPRSPIPLPLTTQALENDLCCTPAAPSTTNAAGNYPGGAASTPTFTAGRTAPRWPESHCALITPSSSRAWASHLLFEALENDVGYAPSEVTAFEKDLSLGKAPVSALYMLEADLSSSLEAAAEPENSAAIWQALLREVLSRGDLAENNHRLLAPISKCAVYGL